MDSGPHGLTLGVLRPHLVVSWQVQGEKAETNNPGERGSSRPPKGKPAEQEGEGAGLVRGRLRHN